MPTKIFKEGKKKTGGRQKGQPNKFTNLKQAFLDTYEKIETEAGKNNNTKSLYEWAIKCDRNQGVFYQMISKMLPTNADLDVKGDIGITIKRIISDERPEG